MTEFVDCDSDIELFEMSAEKSEKALLVNTTDRDKISYSSADDSVNVGNEPGHRKVVLNKQKEKTKLSGFLLLLSFFAAIGGFLFGYDTGVVSGAMLLLKTNFDLSSFSEEVIVSVTIGSAAVFSICSGVLNEYLGRKLTIIIGSFVFTAGAIVLAVAQNIAMLISGRAILGIGIGIASMTVPTYIAECAPSELRGRLVTINNLFITGGQFIASVLDGAFSYDKTNGWRYMFGLAGVPSAIQFVGFFFLPESPRWLISKGKEVEARKVLCKIRGHSYVEEELQEIIQKFEEERESTNKAEEYIIVRVIKTPSVRRALILGSFLQIFQQLSGINTVIQVRFFENFKSNTGIFSGVKGRLAKSIQYWEHIGANSFILDTLKNGYLIPFIDTPSSMYMKNNKSALKNDDFVSKYVNELVLSGCVIEVPFQPYIVNPLSVATQKSGKRRLILDLSTLNLSVKKEKIKFEDWKIAVQYFQKNDYLYKFDLKSGYFHLDICPQQHTYLGFSWEDKFYCFTVSAFGLSTGPYIFTKCLRPLVKYWRKNGIKIVLYLDDGFGMNN
ncbi:MFS transporter, SP family, solute carrier family 2 (myo-inositol transporter), member 13 [Mytilus galloprovincialis]|uniref:MFS transporter, SP family, solute carrier family 2 (Myo-inositol transporter), member 13 n=1 Tax=Mytilus galloprovincialis TaxID=29158 RepID=A0A8B6D553_MYTGA|nr:MFS transporter, SP family, solute carrier family 2 (myo-inositol transporter), member 13 [Mytilus galloprovincialis]